MNILQQPLNSRNSNRGSALVGSVCNDVCSSGLLPSISKTLYIITNYKVLTDFSGLSELNSICPYGQMVYNKNGSLFIKTGEVWNVIAIILII